MMNLIRNFVRDEKGEDLIEYGLLAAFVATLAIALLFGPGGATLKSALANAFNKAASVLSL